MPLTSFPQFGRLPIEIRHLIWREYLSLHCQLDKPTLYLYSKNLFLKHLDPEHEDERYAGISHTPSVEISPPPSLLVNSEARSATLQWARTGDVELGRRPRTTPRRRGQVFTRPFDPARDVLYVSRDKWDEFCELSFDGDGLEETTAQIQHLAFPAFTAYYSFAELGYLMGWFTSLKTLSSVWGPLPELEYARTRRFVPEWRKQQQQQQHLLGETDDDGTDTGVDPVTGEMEEQIAAEVQPRWVLEEETAEMVMMCVSDPFDGSWEMGERDLWMGELEEAMLTVELPEHVYDVEEEKFLVDFRAVRAKKLG
ncbi:hypothetical protein E4U43_000702 [Claviceps pusilla]|uniref:2EXR domain-containing protein n=1 Tax=Claviceps pusilla TaxID=123648 RepID=A0A9P7NBG7_9HYPO|nr:hypothetical protein E4U43_000702 [Claviceps pusilla]